MEGVLYQNIRGVGIASRPFVSAIAGFAATVAMLEAQQTLVTAFAAGVCFCLATMAGFVFNDICDREKDRFSQAIKPFVQQQISLAFAVKLIGAMLGLAAFTAAMFLGARALAWFLLTALAILAYSPFALRFPLMKNFYTAGLVTTPFLFANLVTGTDVTFAFLGIVFLYVVFRELLLDALDVEADGKVGFITVASKLGSSASIAIAHVSMLLTLGYGAFLFSGAYGAIFLLIALGLQVVAMGMFWLRPATGVMITRLVFVACLCALI